MRYFILFLLRLSCISFFFFFNDTATTEIYTLSLHDALPISMNVGGPFGSRVSALQLGWFILVLVSFFAPAAERAQSGTSPDDVTFTKDIVPILQRSCQPCHRPDRVAPMPLVTYEQVRPWAREMKVRTSIGPPAGVMPPWIVEEEIGIQKFKKDLSLTDEEIDKVAKWANSGAP